MIVFHSFMYYTIIRQGLKILMWLFFHGSITREIFFGWMGA